MKRYLFLVRPDYIKHSWCCPGHDNWPSSTYKNRRSKKARSKSKKQERRLARRVLKQRLTTIR